MSNKYLLPQELAKPPIEEAIFELRFQRVADLASGSVASHLRRAIGVDYPRSEAIPVAAALDHFRAPRPDARYDPNFKLSGDHGSVLIAEGAVRLRLVGAYPGWKPVRARIDALLDVLRASKLIGELESISLKFVNVLRDPPPRQLEALRVDLRVNGEAVSEQGLRVRMELSDERYERVAEIEPGVSGPFLAEHRDLHGLMLALEVRRDLRDSDFWTEREGVLENLHFELRALFFRLLRSAEVDKLGPIYRDSPEA